MVKVLIPTKSDDADAIYVKLALEKKGHECIIFYTADFPERQVHSFELKEGGVDWYACGPDFHINKNHQFDVVWLRRPRMPKMPAIIHEEDIKHARDEHTAFFRTFWQVISPHAFWVNPINVVRVANCKLLQLKIAMEVGFNIPNSLFSNDPARVKEFISKNRENKVIYKTLSPAMWSAKNELRITYTDEITVDRLPSDIMVQCSPGIYQEKINKKFELRVTCFGESIIAVKIESQKHPRGMMDWRYIPSNQLGIERYILPADIEKKCKQFMKKLGLVMGCFDFIVTPDNEYYFLEVNEQGQFLWIEEINHDIKMLDAFSEFLIHAKRDFKWKPSGKSLSLHDLKPEMIPLQEEAIVKHINPDTFPYRPTMEAQT
jgi:glutathione synthase/RimK-type ligase-like ATP-grasp enzyme